MSNVISKSQFIVLRKRKRKTKYLLYLDINKDGKRSCENLNLYISLNQRLTQEDKRILALAESIKAKRLLELQNKDFGELVVIDKNKDFILYFQQLMSKKTESTKKKWLNTLKKITAFQNTILFKDIDKIWIENFQNFLLAELSEMTAYIYYSTFVAAMNHAYKNDIIKMNPCRLVKNITRPKSLPKYLTLEDINIIKEHNINNVVYNAFFFSLYTGLRISDIRRLEWKQIKQDKNKFFIDYTQTKTKTDEILPIPSPAMIYLTKTDNQVCFPNFPDDRQMSRIMAKWKKLAGIDKKFTFHIARHSYATLLLTSGADLYTVSKLLGHSDIKVTQIYAKIIDSKKRDAVNLLPEL